MLLQLSTLYLYLSKQLKQRTMEKKCKLCGETSGLEVHHIIPVSRGGTNDRKNLITLCSVCHGKAHNVDFKHDRGGLVKEGVEKTKLKSKKHIKTLKDASVDEILEYIYSSIEDSEYASWLADSIMYAKFDATNLYELIALGKTTKRIVFKIK